MAEQNANEELWRAMLTGDEPAMRNKRRRNRRLPGKPRCKSCLWPLGGPVAGVLGVFTDRGRSPRNPNYCNLCETFVRTHPGGAEIELSLLFADVRGSTSIAERTPPAEFGRLMNRFYEAANRVLIDSDAMVDKIVGDEVIGHYLPFLGDDHPRTAILAARKLLLATGHADPSGPWLPVGAGVHTGTAYVGSIGTSDTVSDLTALGDAVNVAARLASLASEGEVLISEQAYAAAGLDLRPIERRRLELKGRSVPADVVVLSIGANEPVPV